MGRRSQPGSRQPFSFLGRQVPNNFNDRKAFRATGVSADRKLTTSIEEGAVVLIQKQSA